MSTSEKKPADENRRKSDTADEKRSNINDVIHNEKVKDLGESPAGFANGDELADLVAIEDPERDETNHLMLDTAQSMIDE